MISNSWSHYKFASVSAQVAPPGGQAYDGVRMSSLGFWDSGSIPPTHSIGRNVTASSPAVSLPTITFLTYNFRATGSTVHKAYAGPEKGVSKTETQEPFPDQFYNIPPNTVSYFNVLRKFIFRIHHKPRGKAYSFVAKLLLVYISDT